MLMAYSCYYNSIVSPVILFVKNKHPFSAIGKAFLKLEVETQMRELAPI